MKLYERVRAAIGILFRRGGRKGIEERKGIASLAKTTGTHHRRAEKPLAKAQRTSLARREESKADGAGWQSAAGVGAALDSEEAEGNGQRVEGAGPELTRQEPFEEEGAVNAGLNADLSPGVEPRQEEGMGEDEPDASHSEADIEKMVKRVVEQGRGLSAGHADPTDSNEALQAAVAQLEARLEEQDNRIAADSAEIKERLGRVENQLNFNRQL